MLSGGAPLAPYTHDYLKTVFGLPLLQVKDYISYNLFR
jgi:hypothetical protein